MNAQERKALKRASTSKETWKAKDRKKAMHLLRMRIRDLERSRNRWKVKFFRIKEAAALNGKDAAKARSESKTSLERSSEEDEKKIDPSLHNPDRRLFGFVPFRT